MREDVVDVAADLAVGGQQAEIGIQPGRARVIVARAQMGIGHEHGLAADATLATEYQRELGVGLQAEHAVDHLRAGVLELAPPS